jgi:tetratricopeptide (TPR) repeat protein
MQQQGCPKQSRAREYIEKMHWTSKTWCGWVLLCVLLAAPAAFAQGNTIVLKNGRRIAALTVTQEGDKVRYETPAGELTLPRAIVDHVESGGMPTHGDSADAGKLSLKPPEAAPADSVLTGRTEIEARVIQDGEVDRNYVAKLENEALSGQPLANWNAALAHHTASQFELAHGEMDLALADEQQALKFAPQQPVFLMNAAYLHLRRSEYTQSLEYLERARRVAPEDPDVAKLTGWAYHGLNKMDQAVAEWQHALALRPDAETEAALKKALRDKEEEAHYKENESRHFTLRYSGAAEPAMARDVLRMLEHHFDAIESELSYSPPDAIGVILYTQQAFADITQAPAWVGALNDGRIRVPVQGLSSVTPELSRVLRHELTHSFIQQKARGRAPTWIQEGLAQWMEGKRSDANSAALILMAASTPEQAAEHFEGDWMKMSKEVVGLAYAWALANVECILHAGGMTDLDRIMSRLASGEAPEAATKAVTRSDYAELTSDTVDYLRRTYGK